MTEKEVNEAYDELKAQISKLLWDFSDKYLSDKKNIPLAMHIMSSVLSESASEVENHLCIMTPFTERQKDHICFQIGEWYFSTKHLLEGTHNLGFMKERLKTMICDKA